MRSLLLAGVLLFSTLPANAASERIDCGQVAGMDFCLIDTMADDIIMIIGPGGGERITVDCSTGKWTAYGQNTEEFVQSTVSTYCSN